jgi:hypothetical protein
MYLYLGGWVFVVVYLRGARREASHSLQVLVEEVVGGPESVVQPVVVVVPAPGLATELVELVKLIKLREEVWSMAVSRKTLRNS